MSAVGLAISQTSTCPLNQDWSLLQQIRLINLFWLEVIQPGEPMLCYSTDYTVSLAQSWIYDKPIFWSRGQQITSHVKHTMNTFSVLFFVVVAQQWYLLLSSIVLSVNRLWARTAITLSTPGTIVRSGPIRKQGELCDNRCELYGYRYLIGIQLQLHTILYNC